MLLCCVLLTVWRVSLQRIHAALHGVGFVSTVVGLVAVFRFHNEHHIPNLYSLHSWLGLLVVVAFAALVRPALARAPPVGRVH